MAAGGGGGGAGGAGAGWGAGPGTGFDANASPVSPTSHAPATYASADPGGRIALMVDPSWGQVSERGGQPWTSADTFASRYGYNFNPAAAPIINARAPFNAMRPASPDYRGSEAYGPASGTTRISGAGGMRNAPVQNLNSYAPGEAGEAITSGEYPAEIFGHLQNDPQLFDQLRGHGVTPEEVANEVQQGFINRGIPGNQPIGAIDPGAMQHAGIVLGRYGIGSGEIGDVPTGPGGQQQVQMPEGWQMGGLAAGPWSGLR